MVSIIAENVAKKVSETIRKKKRVILGEIIKDSGYSESTSKSPTIVTRTKSYQRAIKPLADGIDKEIDRIKREMSSRDISEERYESLANVLDKLVKNHQLLTGGATENIKVIPILDVFIQNSNIHEEDSSTEEKD